MILLIDNYDSFTYNLAHMLGELHSNVKVLRNDDISPSEAIGLNPSHIVISPGPGSPATAGICLELIKCLSKKTIPLLGVCLGHQAIGEAFGGSIIKADNVMHGKLDQIFHSSTGIFEGIPSPFNATRYHSLVVDPTKILPEIDITAKTADGVIMGLQHRNLPIFGVQFHPESILSEWGQPLLKNFIKILE